MADNDDTVSLVKLTKRQREIVKESLAIEAEAAREAGAIGYMARALVQATMPHRKTTEFAFYRRNGAFSMGIMAHPDIGLPYGSVPRLLMAFLSTEAVRTNNREISLGGSLSEFMTTLGEVPTGGRWGSITRVREQTRRLLASSVSCVYTAESRDAIINLNIADYADLWWSPKNPHQEGLFESHVRLGERFFEEVTQNPVPIDVRALKLLKKSPMALDIYCWLTYRMSYLSKDTLIPWEGLQAQFGADYARLVDFRRKFRQQLMVVQAVYPAANVRDMPGGLLLKPSRTHVPKITQKP